MIRWLSLLPLAACLGTSEDPGACELADENQACPECSSGPTTCSFGDTSVTENSCGDCQARSGLYAELCDAGETATREEIEAQTVCEPTVCEVWYEGCSDPCTPQCVPAASIPDTTCDMGCTNPTPPPGECTWTGSECGFVLTAR